jgi:spore coat protein H
MTRSRHPGIWFVFAATAALTAACRGGQDEPLAAVPGPDGGEVVGGAGRAPTEGACGPIDATLTDADADDLFGASSVPTFDLYLPATDWQSLQEHATDEEYVEAEACYEGRSLGPIGLRFKGSYGSLYSCFDDQGVNHCRKLGIKLKFSKYYPEQRFFGLKRLNLQGYRYDATYVKERLAYDLYRSAGIVAPRAAWALVRVNDEPQGLFGMVEEIDGRFTADRWPENPDQNLYKEAWPVQTDATWVASRLKTNEEQGDVAAFVAFSQAMLDADDDSLRDTLGEYTDLDYFARYMAVDDAIANFDGVTAYYASDDLVWAGNHNFYFYEEAPDHFTIVPWDLESTLLPNAGFGDVPHWTEVPEDCQRVYSTWSGATTAIAPGCDRVFRALAADLGAYRAAGQELLDGSFSEAAVAAAIDEHADFVRAHAVADPNGPGAEAFEREVKNLKDKLPLLRDRFQRLLAGESWTTFEISTTATNDLEAQTDFGVVVGAYFGTNPASTMTVTVNTTDPMFGSRDLRLAFDYANEAEPWQQWSYYLVQLAQRPFDVTALTGIRLWARADQPRSLRLDLDSPAESAASEGIRLGWDVALTSEPTLIEVRFDAAAVVPWAVDEGRDPGDDPRAILAAVTGLSFQPQCVGRDTGGQLPDGETDAGFVDIDDLEFF